MDWEKASSHYETRLEHILSVQKQALDLANLPQTGISEDKKKKLIDEGITADRQLERLKKGEFRIAVVGLEKSGKSTFVNAWLDCDLLPTKGGRCTFTTTQVLSVRNDTQQVLEVQTKSEEQFAQLVNELRLAATNNDKAKEDLETIHRYATTLKQVRDEGDQKIPFSRLEDIKQDLRKYVADEQFAHAVREVRLYTNKLVQAEGIVFYDVPGLDSGLAKHVEESQEMLSDCDAIIVIQRFRNIRGAELQIIQFAEEGDPNIKIADKLFVFLSYIDLQGSDAAMKEHVSVASDDWYQRARLPEQRIVPGTAGSYLVLRGIASEETLNEVGTTDVVKHRLAMLTGIDNSEQLLNEVTGISEIKGRVNNYINTERVEVLKKRCEASIKGILSIAEGIRESVSKRYSDNPEEAKRHEEDRKRINFSKWWERKWEGICADLADYYDLKIRKSSRSASNSTQPSTNLSIAEHFHDRYLDHVEQLFKEFRERTNKRREIIFRKHSVVQFDAVEANFDWREELYSDISQMLLDISKELALELRQEALQLVDYISSLMWNSPEVKRYLVEDTEVYVEMLNRSLSVLFLRFARPMVEALVRGPVESEKRKNIVKQLGPDIEILDNYYSGEEPEFRVLKKLANHGEKLLYDRSTREKVLGVQGVFKQIVDSTDVQEFIEGVADSVNAQDIVGQITDSELTSEQLLIREVEADLLAVERYLRAAVFEAAGFKQYCLQELDRLRDNFINSRAVWNGVAMNEWLRENPLLLKELPDELQKFEVNLEVSRLLRELIIALNKMSYQSMIV